MRKISAQDFIKRKNDKWEKELKNQETCIFKDISRKGKHHFLREKWTFLAQHNYAEKVFVIERLRRTRIEGQNSCPQSEKGDVEYRFGYYIVGKKGNKKDKWTWGQYCPLISAKDLQRLLKRAEKDGTLIL